MTPKHAVPSLGEGATEPPPLRPPLRRFVAQAEPDPQRLISDWSHRHLAVLAGLGKPGHHNLLITERGCVGRLSSYVTDVPAEADPGPTHEPCLHRAGRTCLRCVAGALGRDAFDRQACYAQCLENDWRWPELGVTDVCAPT